MGSRIHVVQNGAYVLETAAIPIVTGITQTNPPVVTSVAHGLSNGNLVHISGVVGMTELNGRIFRVKNPTANTFELYHANNNSVDASGYGAWVSGGTIYAVVEISTPYAGADITTLQMKQHQNEMTITHANYATRTLIFTDAQTWTLAEIDFESSVTAPSGLVVTPDTAGTAGVAVAVTALSSEGVESGIASYTFNELCEAPSATEPSNLYTWGAVAGAVEYYLYRSLVSAKGSNISAAEELGYIGRALSPQFNDPYITPDFTKSPPQHQNPFVGAGVQYITMTAIGTGYAKTDTVTVSGGGSNFAGYPVVNAAGEILGVVVLNGGKDYVTPTVAFGTSGGSGATATATLTPATGNYPAVSARFQQRGVYGGTNNFPMTLWGSRPGDSSNLDTSSVLNAGDSYEATLDSEDIQPLRHLIPCRSGLLMLLASRIDQLTGTGNVVVSPVNLSILPQVSLGVSTVAPVVIETSILYTPPFGTSLIELSYTAYTKSFAARDLSILSSHLLATKEKTITRLAFAEEPHKLVYAVREDGRLLTLTYDPAQEVYGWAQHYTHGTFDDVEVVRESDGDIPYFIVVRQTEGESIRYLERLTPSKFTHVETYIGVDSALTYPLAEISVNGTLSAGTGTGVTFTVTSAATPFVVGDVGSVFYILGGKATIASYVSSTVITLDFTRDIIPDETQGGVNDPVIIGKHFLDRKIQYGPAVTNVTGLYHLEGEAVSILADGVEVTGRTVVNGTLDIPLTVAASRIAIGLAFKCQIKTLPASSNQVNVNGKLRNTYATAMYLQQTKGLFTGVSFDKLYPVKARTDTDWDSTSGARNDIVEENLRNAWDREGSVCIEQDAPYPATVLGLALSVEVEGQ